jgi:hypothetical protein
MKVSGRATSSSGSTFGRNTPNQLDQCSRSHRCGEYNKAQIKVFPTFIDEIGKPPWTDDTADAGTDGKEESDRERSNLEREYLTCGKLAAAEAKKKVTIHARAVFACYASAAAIGARAIWSGLQGRTAQHVAGREEAAADRVVERDWPEDLPAALWQAELTALLPVVTPDGEAPCPTRGGAVSSRCSAARRWLGRSRRGRSRRRCR